MPVTWFQARGVGVVAFVMQVMGPNNHRVVPSLGFSSSFFARLFPHLSISNDEMLGDRKRILKKNSKKLPEAVANKRCIE